MQSIRDQYDWVVIGDSPAALLSAALVGKLGLSVLIIPFPGSSFPNNEFTPSNSAFLDFEFESNQIPFLGGMSKLSKIFEELGVNRSNWPYKTEPVVLMNTKDKFVSTYDKDYINLLSPLGFNQNTWESQIYNLGQYQEIETFFENYRDFFVWSDQDKSKKNIDLEVKRLLKSKQGFLPSIEEFTDRFAIIGKALGYASELDIEKLQSKEISLLSHHILKNTTLFNLGFGKYRKWLIDLGIKNGAHFLEEGVCKRIFIERGKVVGLQAAYRGQVIEVGDAILGRSLSSVQQVFHSSGKGWGIGNIKDSPKCKFWKLSLKVVADSKVVFDGCPKRMVWQEAGAPALEIEIAEGETSSHGQKTVVFYVRSLLDFLQSSLSLVEQRKRLARMYAKLTELFPGLKDKTISLYPDWKKGDDEVLALYGFASLELIPDTLKSFSEAGLGATTGIEGLYCATYESFPELGTWGPYHASILAVSHLAHRHGLKGPWKDYD